MDASLARNAVFAAIAAGLLSATDAAARGRGYSVEAAAGVSQGSSVQTSYDAHPYRPFSEFGKSDAPRSAAPAPRTLTIVPTPTAQDPGDRESHPERMGIDPTAVRVDDAPKGSVEGKPPEVTAEDAAANFPALVETFFRNAGADGVWTFVDGGRARKFTLVSAEAKRLKSLGGGFFQGLALLRDASTRKPVVAEVVADYSQTEWKVVSVLPFVAAKGAAKAAAKPAAQR